MVTIACYGGGTNSTAMLIECAKRGIMIDLILFADTGGEKPHTYQYVKTFSAWLLNNGMPEIILVKSPNETLEQSCNKLRVLPSIAYGFKTCSQRFKIQPQDKYINNWDVAQDEWSAGRKITKLVGYDADEHHRIKDYSDDKYTLSYPLVDWDMGRDECLKTISDAGLCPPGKSACFFCPSTKPSEIKWLAKNYPDLAARALKIEADADLETIKGLGRNFAWRDLLAQRDFFDADFGVTPEMVCGCYDG